MPIISISFYMVLIRIAMKRKNMDRVLTTLRGIAPLEPRETGYGMKPSQAQISQFSKKDLTSHQPRSHNIEKELPAGPRHIQGSRGAYQV